MHNSRSALLVFQTKPNHFSCETNQTGLIARETIFHQITNAKSKPLQPVSMQIISSLS